MAQEIRIPNGPLYVDLDGFRLGRGYSLELFRSALKYQPLEGDTFVVSFPKCGSTWTQYIAYLICHKGIPPSSALEIIRWSPYLDMYGGESLGNPESRGVMKSHLPYNLMPREEQAKYIYICRNPKDTCVSLFYQTRGFSTYDFPNGTFDVFFDIFMSGRNHYGDYFDHVLSWYDHRNDPNVLFIHYEEMKTEPKRFILEIAKFLGKRYHEILIQDSDMLDSVLRCSDISVMKGYADSNFKEFFRSRLEGENIPMGARLLHRAGQSSPSESSLFRKGVIGDWRNHMTAEMNTMMENKIYEKLSHTDFISVWRKHGVI